MHQSDSVKKSSIIFVFLLLCIHFFFFQIDLNSEDEIYYRPFAPRSDAHQIASCKQTLSVLMTMAIWIVDHRLDLAKWMGSVVQFSNLNILQLDRENSHFQHQPESIPKNTAKRWNLFPCEISNYSRWPVHNDLLLLFYSSFFQELNTKLFENWENKIEGLCSGRKHKHKPIDLPPSNIDFASEKYVPKWLSWIII